MGPGPNARGASRSHIIDAVKASLKHLQIYHIDPHQIHGFDPATSTEEKMRALDHLVQQGHVRYVGVSNWAAWQIAKAQGIAERLGLGRLQSPQAYYTVAGRYLERELIPMLKSECVGQMVWSPLAGGLLSGKFALVQNGANTAEEGSRRTSFDFPPVNRARADDCIKTMRPMAQVRGVSVAQIALAWLLQQPQITSVMIGAKQPDQLADNMAAVHVVLSEDELKQLDAVSQLSAEYPGWMFERQGEYRRKQMLGA